MSARENSSKKEVSTSKVTVFLLLKHCQRDVYFRNSQTVLIMLYGMFHENSLSAQLSKHDHHEHTPETFCVKSQPIDSIGILNVCPKLVQLEKFSSCRRTD
jgi:hypothetical protein